MYRVFRVRSRFMLDMLAPVGVLHFGTGSGTWATVAPVAVLHVGSASGGAEPSSLVTSSSSAGGGRIVLVELGARGAALCGGAGGAQPGASVSEVAAPFRGDASVGASLAAQVCGARGLAGLVDESTVPGSCPHQMAPAVEARIVELRREHPGWGPRTIGHRLARVTGGAVAGAVVDLSVSGASPSDRAGGRRRKRRITSVGSGRGRWSCGRWTSLVACSLADGWRRRSSRGSMIIRGSWSRRRWWIGRRRGRCVMRWRSRCGPMGCPIDLHR